MAMYCDDPMPFGKLTRKHLYALGSGVFSDFNAMAYALSSPEPGAPTLEPAMRAGGLFLYDEGAGEAWIAAMRVWKEGAPARRAAKKAEDDARLAERTRAEMERIRLEQDSLQASLQASAGFREKQAEFDAPPTPIIQAGRG